MAGGCGLWGAVSWSLYLKSAFSPNIDPYIATLVICVYTLIPLFKRLTVSDETYRIDQFIERTIGYRQIPGLILAVVKDGRVAYTKGYGTKNIDTGEEVTDESLFQIASLTKAFTATILVDLLKTTQYSTSTKLKDIFPEFVIDSCELRTEYATIEDLLSHRLGIPDNNFIRLDPKLTRANLIRRIKYFQQRGTFRGSFHYSNLFYGVLTHLIEHIGNDTYENIVTEKLFRPLGMDSSTFASTADFNTLGVTTGYREINGELQTVSPVFSKHWATLVGSGGIISTAKDMAKWMLFHLERGKNMQGVSVINEDVLTETYEPRLISPCKWKDMYFRRPDVPVSTIEDSYALGWKQGYYRGYRMLTHVGSTPGFKASLVLMPDKNLGIFTAMNGPDKHCIYRTLLHNFIADVYLGETPWVNETIGCTFPKKKQEKATPLLNDSASIVGSSLNRPVEDYIGTYYNPGYGEMHVFRNTSCESGLGLKYGIADYQLKLLGSDKFYGDTYGLAYFYKVKEFQFSMSTPSTERMDIITVPAYEQNFPPVFHLIRNED